MPQLLVRNLQEETVKSLKQRAKAVRQVKLVISDQVKVLVWEI